MLGKNYLKVLGMAVLFTFIYSFSFAQTGPTYSDSWTAAPGFVPQMPYATISENENVNIYNGNLTVIYPIGPAIPVGPELSFQAKLRYIGVGSGGAVIAYGEDSIDFKKPTVNAGQWTVSYGMIFLQRQYVANPSPPPDKVCGGCTIIFMDEAGTSHQLHESLESNAFFTIDGSNLHAIYYAGTGNNDSSWTLYYPDGVMKILGQIVVDSGDGTCSGCVAPTNHSWYTTKVMDRFDNGFEVVYDENTKVISEIHDIRSTGRKISFNYQTEYSIPYLSSIVVPTTTGNVSYTLTREFNTAHTVAKLKEILFPQVGTESQLKMQFSYYDQTTECPDNPSLCNKSYALRRITYPTGGWTEYDYADYTYSLNFIEYPNKGEGDHNIKDGLHMTGGFGVSKITKSDNTPNLTIRQLTRISRQDGQCAPFAAIQETLPDGQKILHLCELGFDLEDGHLNSYKKGKEVVIAYFPFASSWTEIMRWAFATYPRSGSSCSYDGSPPSSTIYPLKVVENKWMRMKYKDEFIDSLPPETWEIVKSTSNEYSGSSSLKTSIVTENLFWDNYGHFMVTRQYDGVDLTKPSKVTIRQYIPPFGTKNLRNREEFEATFYALNSDFPQSLSHSFMPGDNCEDCNGDPDPNNPFQTSASEGNVTAGFSQFFQKRTPATTYWDYTGNAKTRIAIASPLSSYTLHQGTVNNAPYWYWIQNVASKTPASADWVETRDYNTSTASGDNYPGTISKIHLSYGPYDSAKDRGVEYEYSYGIVKSKKFIGMNYKEAERGINKYTGLIEWERDANSIGADYTYDNLLRLIQITPTQGEAPEHIYYPVLGGYTKRIEYGRGYNPSLGGTVPVLATHKVFEFDGLGRLIKSKEIMADGNYSVVEKAYDPNGREFFVSEPYAESNPYAASFPHQSISYSVLPYSLSLPKKTGQTCFYGTLSTIFPSGSCSDPFAGTPDTLGRVRRVIKPDGSYTDTSYDGFNYTVTLHGIAGAGDSATTYEKDAFDRLIHIDAPAGTDADYYYDSQDRLIKVKLGTQERTFEYNALGFLKNNQNPENGLVTIDSYDVWGNILEYHDANATQGNYSVTNTYDKKGRLTDKSKIASQGFSSANPKLLGKWTYDSGINNRLTTSITYDGQTGASYREDFTYAGLNKRLSKKNSSYSLISFSEMLPPNAYSTNYEYDLYGQVSREYILLGTTNLADTTTGYSHGFAVDKKFPDEKGVHNLSYHPSGALNIIHYGTGTGTPAVTSTMALEDNTSRLKSITAGYSNGQWATGDYQYDGVGNIKAIGMQTFQYDALSRLVTANITKRVGSTTNLLPTITYSYDKFGNLISRDMGQNPSLPWINDPKVKSDFLSSVNFEATIIMPTETQVENNRIETFKQNRVQVSPPTYDLNGNITFLHGIDPTKPDGVTSTYDCRNYLRTVAGTANNKNYAETYMYDSAGERVAAIRFDDKNNLGSATYYLRSGSQVLAEETMTFLPNNPQNPIDKDRVKSYLYLGSNLAATKETNSSPSSPTYGITGKVKCNGCGTTAYLGGVSVCAGASCSISSDSGDFSITGLSAGTYNMTATKPGYTCVMTDAQGVPVNPTQVIISNKDVIAYFTATQDETGDRAVSGKITLNGAPLGNVTIISGSLSTISEPSSGNYSLRGFFNGSTVRLTPSLAGYAFVPPFRDVTFGEIDVTGQDFQASAASSFSISGRVSYLDWGLSGVTVTIGGKTDTTDVSGNYSITDLESGNYTVMATFPGHDYTFVPEFTQPVTVGPYDKTGINFVAKGSYMIHGYIKCKGIGLAGVPVGISQGNCWDYTDDSGYYSLEGLASGNYHVSPGYKEGYSFQPTSYDLTLSGSNKQADFTAFPTVSGFVSRWGYGFSGVTMTATGPGGSFTTTSQMNGKFVFKNLADGTYTITASMPDYTLSPSSQTVALTGAPISGVDFIAEPSGPYISGQLKDGGGFSRLLNGIEVTAGDMLARTDIHGIYVFNGLALGSYTVKPLPNAWFSQYDPPTQDVDLRNDNHPAQGVDFYAFTGTPAYAISGTVLLSGAGLPGVLVLASDATTGQVAAGDYTDLSGNFTLPSVPNGTYSIVANLYGHSFDPTPRSVTVLHDHLYAQDFTATVLPTYNLAGYVVCDGAGVQGVTIRADQYHCVTTDTLGYFFIEDLPQGSYTITASKQGYGFSPQSQYLNLTEEMENLEIMAWRLTYAISGSLYKQVGLNRVPIPGVEVTCGGITSYTDTAGAFMLESYLPGSYTLTFYMPGFIFDPNPCNVTVSYNDSTAGQIRGYEVGTASIYGNIKSPSTNQGVKGVRVWTTNAASKLIETYTDGSGNYSLADLEKSSSYSVMAELPGFYFTSDSSFNPKPVPLAVSTLNMDKSLNMLAQRNSGQWGISGYVLQQRTAPFPGVNIIVTDSNNEVVRETTTLSDGWFYAGGLPGTTGGITYTVTPQLLGWGFRPSNASVTLNTADYVVSTPFNGSLLTYCISGTVLGSSGLGVPNVTLELQEAGSQTITLTMTNSFGNYRFCGLSNGRYYVTSPEGYRYFGIMPVSVYYTDIYDINFEKWPPFDTTQTAESGALLEKEKAKALESMTMKTARHTDMEIAAPPAAIAAGTPEATPADLRFYVWDHLGTTRVITDGSGNLISTHDYEPFGVEIPPATSGTVTDYPSPNSHKFTGHERDARTGMDYMHFRYYGSNIGRFMKPDNVTGSPLNPQNWNLYSYVRGNPVNMNDPTGHEGETKAKTEPVKSEEAAKEVIEQIKEEATGNQEEAANKPPEGVGDNAATQLDSNNCVADQQANNPQALAAAPEQGTSNVQIYYNTGMVETREGGTRAWRNNNPGNIRFGNFTLSQGAIGEAGGFAVFPSAGAGATALTNLLQTPQYQTLTVDQAIERYAPPNENNTENYQAWVGTQAGVTGTTRLSTLTCEQLGSIQNAIQRIEGWREGTVTTGY